MYGEVEMIGEEAVQSCLMALSRQSSGRNEANHETCWDNRFLVRDNIGVLIRDGSTARMQIMNVST
jgi:hypothetical protein